LQRYGLPLRSARVQQFSPDPDYASKLADLEMALWEARRYPRSVVAVFLDQRGFTRWPDLDNYIIGREKVIACYRQLVQAYPQARRLYAIQDNWSIHKHPEVVEALRAWPQIEPVWLPTYAPWLNPIEKLWRLLRQKVLHLHRLADDWRALRDRVRAFLDQFAHGSERLLEYVRLLGNGLIARMIHGPWLPNLGIKTH
jgi:transposase